MQVIGYFVVILLYSVTPSDSATCSHAKPADVIFLLDGSGSVRPANFVRSLEFVNRIVGGFQIDSLSTQISVAVFTDVSVDFKFKLNTFNSKEALQQNILSIGFPSLGENISDALEQARHKFLDSSFGSRPSAAGIVVLMTDGQSYSIEPSFESAQKLKDMGITIYTAGVGNYVNENELRGIASDPTYYFSCSDFASLDPLTGPLTESACNDIDEWDGCKCLNGGTCVPGNLGASCACPPIYAGFYCDKPVCEVASPCVKGTCSVSDNMWVCTCPPGYTGATCDTDINECDSNPCINGTCSNLLNRFSCSCTPGFTGLLCEEEIDECAVHPCKHDGNCTDLINAFSCDCKPGYTGHVCETDIDECASTPCQNGGICNDRVNAFTCECPSGYYGEFCETGICQPSVADIVFVLDSSVSQTETQFNKQLEFINQFIDHIVIGEKDLQVGVVTFSFQAKIEIQLGEYNDNVTLKDAVRNIKYRPGATFTDKGLEAAMEVFTQAPEKRPYGKVAKRYVYVMTDGMSTNRWETRQRADDLKKVVNKVLAIGIGTQVSHQELLTIASKDTSRDRKYVYSVQNFDALYTILKELVKLTCDECTWNTTSDIVFLLDASSAMRMQEFQSALNAITYITHKIMQMETEDSVVRIGLITYSTDIHLRRPLNDSTTKETFLAEIQGIVLRDGQCSASKTECEVDGLNKAIAFVRGSVFDSSTSVMESYTREMIILLTNGWNMDVMMHDLDTELDQLKTENRTIFTVALGEQADIPTLQKLAGDPALVFSLHDEADLSILDALTTEFFSSSCDLSNDFVNDP